MALDVTAVQSAIRSERLDGWLLYDFHGSNPIATRLAGLMHGAHMTTRRWFYLIPASGQPRGLVHAIERHTLDGLPGEKAVYAGREQLSACARVGFGDGAEHIAHGGSRRRHRGVPAGLSPQHGWDHHRRHRPEP